MYPQSPQNFTDTEAQELPIANAINNYWQPIQTWSTIALSISLYGLYLDRKEKLSLLNLYRKTSNPRPTANQSSHQHPKTRQPTNQAITLEYQKISQTSATFQPS